MSKKALVEKVLKELAKRAENGDDAALVFIHNTSPEKLQRIQDMGGMPMPSIAVTKREIPFEGFGDISLIGKPSSFDPKATKLNKTYSADAYTVRAPQPVRVAKKSAGKKLTQQHGAARTLSAAVAEGGAPAVESPASCGLEILHDAIRERALVAAVETASGIQQRDHRGGGGIGFAEAPLHEAAR